MLPFPQMLLCSLVWGPDHCWPIMLMSYGGWGYIQPDWLLNESKFKAVSPIPSSRAPGLWEIRLHLGILGTAPPHLCKPSSIPFFHTTQISSLLSVSTSPTLILAFIISCLDYRLLAGLSAAKLTPSDPFSMQQPYWSCVLSCVIHFSSVLWWLPIA